MYISLKTILLGATLAAAVPLANNGTDNATHVPHTSVGPNVTIHDDAAVSLNEAGVSGTLVASNGPGCWLKCAFLLDHLGPISKIKCLKDCKAKKEPAYGPDGPDS